MTVARPAIAAGVLLACGVIAVPASAQSADAAPPVPPLPAPSGLKLFPEKPPEMMPYLASVNLYGCTCLQENAAIMGDPLSLAAQAVKTELAKVGINYAVWQSYDFVAMSGTLPGKQSTLSAYTFNSYLTWNVFQSDELSGTSGWLAVGGSASTGLGTDLSKQNPSENLGLIGYPDGSIYGQVAYLYELAWQQSFFDGHFVATVGFMDPEIYMDLNSFSNNQYNQLLNYEFINPSTIPWSFNALGVVLQWQPVDWFYAMFGSLANNTVAGEDPFANLSGDDWTNTFELGFIADDMLGLGRGVYRVLPYWGSYGGESGSGVLLNVEQRLGKDLPFAAFVRTGCTGGGLGNVQNGQANVSCGLVLDGPTESPLLRADQAYFAAGFYWLRGAAPTLAHQDEYGLEFTYVYQLTQTMTLQPDLQVIIDPANNPDAGSEVMFTMQVNMTW